MGGSGTFQLHRAYLDDFLFVLSKNGAFSDTALLNGAVDYIGTLPAADQSSAFTQLKVTINGTSGQDVLIAPRYGAMKESMVLVTLPPTSNLWLPL